MERKLQPPKILIDAGLCIFVNAIELRDFAVSVTEISIKELLWHFDMPVWEKDGTDDWNLTPWDVINKKDGTTKHQQKVQNADLRYPLIITRYKNRLVILDGVHRLVKAYIEGSTVVKAKIIPYEYMQERDT